MHRSAPLDLPNVDASCLRSTVVPRFSRHLLFVVPFVGALVAGCASVSNSNSNSAASPTGGSSPAAATSTPTTPLATTTTAVPDLVMTEGDFKHLADMTKVRGYFVDNLRGQLDEAVAVAGNPAGGMFPVGTIIQLVPQEAMVKRAPGFSPGFGDWEFFELGVSVEGTVIQKRGGREVLNRFGGTSCADCHAKADPQFDFVCEKIHGCDPLPIKDEVFIALQNNDPRPRRTGAAAAIATSKEPAPRP